MKIHAPFYFAFLFLILCPQNSKGAEIERIDHLIDSLRNLDYRDESLIPVLYEIDSSSKALDYKEGIIFAQLQLSLRYREIAPYKSYEYIRSADSLLAKHEELFTCGDLVRHYITKGYNCGYRGYTEQQLYYYLKADTVAKQDTTGQLSLAACFALSDYYFSKKNYEKALVYINQQINYYSKDTAVLSEHSYLIGLSNAGKAHLRLEQYDSSIYCAKKVLELEAAYETQDFWTEYITLARCYMKLKDFEQARYYFQLFEKNPKSRFSADWLSYHAYYGHFHYEIENYDSAIIHYVQELEIIDSLDWLTLKPTANLHILKAELSERGQADLLKYMYAIDSLNKEISSKKDTKFEKQLQIQFETSEKEVKILRLSEENTRRKYTIIKIIVIAIFIVLILFVFIFLFRAKRKKLAYTLERERLTQKLTEAELQKSLENLQNKAELIDQLKHQLQAKHLENITEMNEILDKSYINETDWAAVILHFDSLNDNFTRKVREAYPNITPADIRLLILVNLGYSNKGIAMVNNITEGGVKKAKQRLRQKMGINDLELLKKLG